MRRCLARRSTTVGVLSSRVCYLFLRKRPRVASAGVASSRSWLSSRSRRHGGPAATAETLRTPECSGREGEHRRQCRPKYPSVRLRDYIRFGPFRASPSSIVRPRYVPSDPPSTNKLPLVRPCLLSKAVHGSVQHSKFDESKYIVSSAERIIAGRLI